jgi:hypothetical protein
MSKNNMLTYSKFEQLDLKKDQSCNMKCFSRLWA